MVDDCWVEAGEGGDVFGYAGGGSGIVGASEEVDEVFGGGVGFGVGQVGAGFGLAVGGGEAGEAGDPADGVVGGVAAVEVEDGGDEDEASDADALLVEEGPGEAGGPEAAVAFAGYEDWGADAGVGFEPAADCGGEGLDVAVDGLEGAAGVVVAEGAAVAGSGGVDEDEVGEGEPGFGVVDSGLGPGWG